MSSCSFINNSLLHGSAWCSVAHPRSPGPEPAYRALAPGRVHGRTLKMLKSLSWHPGRPSIKYDRSIERSHGTGCDQSQRVFKNGSAHFLYGDRGMTRRLGFCSTHYLARGYWVFLPPPRRSCLLGTGAGPCIRDWAFDSDLLNSMNFGGYSRGTRQGYLRFSANSFSSILIQVDLSTVLESS